MGTTVVKKGQKKREYTDEERFVLSAQSPVFLKKKKDAEEFIKRVGLPERFADRLKK